MRWRSGPASSTLPAGRGVSNQLTLKLLALAILVAASAVLTGAEAAYFSLGRARLRKLAGSAGEARSPLIERPHDLLVTLLVGITLINIGAAALAATLAEDVFGARYGLLVEIIGMILILTTFGEVLPMAFAVKYPEQFLTLARGTVAWLSVILKPVRSTLGALTTLTVHLIGSERQAHPELTEEELRTLVDVGAKEGVVEREEREMIHKVFELEDTLVRSVMVPRTDMFCLDVETSAAKILPALREHLHSRVPVFEGSIDVIVGVLYTKDLLPYVRGLPPDFDLRARLHPPYFVPESKRADALLQEFQAKKLHVAIVVDEYGGTAGLVTLEDLLEELVGEISDEYDEPERLIQKIDARTYRVAGKLPVDELNAATGLAISNESYDTVGGWVLDLFGRVPRKGERVGTPGLSVTVEKGERTRVMPRVMLVLGEITPKAVAGKWATSLILRLYRPLTWASRLLVPFVFTANFIVSTMLRLVGGPRPDTRHFVSREELKALLAMEPGEAEVTTQEAEMIDKIFDLGDTTVREIMVPLVEVAMLPDTSTPDDAIALIQRRGFSRIPIYAQRVTNIVGVVGAKDILAPEIGRAHVCTPVTLSSRMPSSAWNK